MNKLMPFILLILLGLCVNCSRKNTQEKAELDKQCLIKHDPGPCRMAINRYYYDETEKTCKQFIYGGCKGSVPFKTLKECQVTCGCVAKDKQE